MAGFNNNRKVVGPPGTLFTFQHILNIPFRKGDEHSPGNSFMLHDEAGTFHYTVNYNNDPKLPLQHETHKLT
jgi:hypothetical protein